jgi:hypothetical protein
LITPHIAARKATEIFCRNMKVLLFDDEEYKGLVFGNYNIDNNLSVYVKKID